MKDLETLTEALAAAKKETAELDERWIGEVMKKDEAIRNLIEERDDLQATVQSLQHDFEIAHKRNLLPKSGIDVYMQKQMAGEPLLLTSIPNPPAEGRWKLGAENGQIDWYNDGPCHVQCDLSTVSMARCDYKWKSVIDGKRRQCQLQNGHPGDHVYQSDATMPLKPGDPAGSGPRN